MIAIACDHSALDMKKVIIELLDQMGLPYHDYGTYTADSCDYPVFAARAAGAVARGECEKGILICGTGIGMSIAANKVDGIRCALCSEPYSAKLTRMHNDSNVLALGARVIGPELARMIAQTWLETPFEGGRHQRRVDLLTALEKGEKME
ncbi:MAG: ribose 5-phosphate isomerase B [Clostridiales bacterium]|jgi:ribose 5-phosphate isomerase B|nr:ribose 5-phosphate isomerase B [Clostridiales bacterium]